MARKMDDIGIGLARGQECACLNLRKASRAVTQLYDKALRASGLRATQLGLLMVTGVQRPLTVKLLSKMTVTDRTTLTRNLKPLEKQGLIRIVPGEDRRERMVTLTDRGQRALANALPLWEKAQTRVFTLLGRKRLRRLLSDLSAMVAVTQQR